MPLKLTLKPNEKVLIGTAVLTNAGPKAEIIVQNTVPVLREKDIITEENADTLDLEASNPAGPGHFGSYNGNLPENSGRKPLPGFKNM